MTSELGKQHKKFQELLDSHFAEPDRRDALERARAEIAAYYDELCRRNNFIEARLRERLIAEFRDNLDIKAPGPLATSTAKALVGVVARLLKDPSLYGEIPRSTATKVEM